MHVATGSGIRIEFFLAHRRRRSFIESNFVQRMNEKHNLRYPINVEVDSFLKKQRLDKKAKFVKFLVGNGARLEELFIMDTVRVNALFDHVNLIVVQPCQSDGNSFGRGSGSSKDKDADPALVLDNHKVTSKQ